MMPVEELLVFEDRLLRGVAQPADQPRGERRFRFVGRSDISTGQADQIPELNDFHGRTIPPHTNTESLHAARPQPIRKSPPRSGALRVGQA